MKNIYFVEAGFSFDNDVYLPYATGCLATYMKEKGCFDEKFNLGGFIYRREQTDSIIEKLDDPHIVGFSCCIWNYRFNLELAKKIKEKFPACFIIFGGHNVSATDNLLKRYDFIDALVFGEGEKTFCDTVNAVDSKEFIGINNISFRQGKNIFVTPYSPPCEIDELPSPYLSGIFDDILKNEDHSSLLCVLETNRGCPYSCAYCDWCSGKKVRLFPIKKVFGELKWFAENKLEYCFCADSNFGMFERDIEIAEYASLLKAEYGYPKVLKTCFAKYSNDTVFRISEILNKAGMDKGATLAYQTLSDTALKNINRTNLTLEHFSGLLQKYNNAGIPTYSELILGLPGETKQSFCEGICRLLESGQHNSLSIYYLEMLPNSEMAQKAFINKHKISAVEVEFNHMHSIKKENEITEFSHIVQSTATLSKEDWIYCNLFSVCVQCFHALGFLRYFALYLFYIENVSYFDFYSSLLSFILNSKDTIINNTFTSFKDKLSSSLSGEWNFTDPEFGEVSWSFEEGAYLRFLQHSDAVRKELSVFLSRYFSDKALFCELEKYQTNILRSWKSNHTEAEFSYDFLSFFNSLEQGKKAELIKEKCVFIFNSVKYSSAKDFAKETVWFGRRKGATIISNKPNSDSSIQRSN